MNRSFQRAACLTSLALAALLAAAPAQARAWAHDPVNLAQDYAVITDNRGHAELVLMMWMAPPMLSRTASSQAAQTILDKYVTLGVVHAHAASDGTMTFDHIEGLEAKDGSGQSLTPLDANTMPPAMVGTLAAMQSVFVRSFGALGKGVQWFAFDSGSVHACAKGGLSVPFAGETYTYDTPFPGCP